jgi:predicted HicB family RNase H-like nuclease
MGRMFVCITYCNTTGVHWVGFMASALTLRLEKKTRQRIARMASRRRMSISDFIREAIEAWVQRQEPIRAPLRSNG